MDKPVMFEPYRAAPDIDVLPSYFPIPGLGILPMNAFVLRAAEPVLVDAGLGLLADEFMEKLSSVIDPSKLRWLWLTHTDQDHIGSLWRVLEEAPKLRVITTYLGVGKMSLYRPLPMDRVFLLNPGQSIDVGNRVLTAIRPPTFDAPETTGFYDPRAAAFFSADCFGTLMSEPAEYAAGIGAKELKEGMFHVGQGGLPVAVRGKQGHVRQGARRHSRYVAKGHHERPSSPRWRHDRPAAGLPGRRAGRGTLCRA